MRDRRHLLRQQRAGRYARSINEVDQHGLALQRRERDRCPVLIDQTHCRRAIVAVGRRVVAPSFAIAARRQRKHRRKNDDAWSASTLPDVASLKHDLALAAEKTARAAPRSAVLMRTPPVPSSCGRLTGTQLAWPSDIRSIG